MSLMSLDRDQFSPSGWFNRFERAAPKGDAMSAARPAWDELGWPAERLGEALAALARPIGLTDGEPDPVAVPGLLSDPDKTEMWLQRQAHLIGVEITPVTIDAAGIAVALETIAPALVRIESQGLTPLFIAVAACRGKTLTIAAPETGRRSLPLALLEAAMLAPLEAGSARGIDAVLDFAGMAGAERHRIRTLLTRDRVADAGVAGVWLVGLPQSASLKSQLSRAGVFRLAWGLLAILCAMQGLEILSWSMIGAAAFNEQFDWGWLTAWMLVMVTLVPFRLANGWLGGSLALTLARLIKTRLMQGSLNLDLSTIRNKGSGHVLGQVMESGAFESLAIHGGLAALSALVELFFAATLMLSFGANLMFALMLGWLVLTFALGWRSARALSSWTGKRLGLTGQMIERMIGHRTILAQENDMSRGADLDQSMSAYLAASRNVDDTSVPFLAGIPFGWTALGILAMVPAFLANAGSADMAIGLGAVLLAGRGFHGLSASLSSASRALTAWQQLAQLFKAGGQKPEAPARPEAATGSDAPVLVEARGLRYRHEGRSDPVINGLDLSIRRGDKVLLQGASGGGKSTLAALLTGLRKPESGLLLVDGYDRPTLGQTWHDRVVMAPQFQENHILSGSLAFNLLLGHRWPARQDDLARAEELARRLGLGPLIDRMPGGLMQMVGETGWQLSHGEKSRIFLARSILQGASLTILDESFAALDPESMALCLECARDMADTLLVIAHP